MEGPIRTFHALVVQRRQRNVPKSVMHVQNGCLGYKAYSNAFLTFSLPSPLLLLKLPTVKNSVTLAILAGGVVRAKVNVQLTRQNFTSAQTTPSATQASTSQVNSVLTVMFLLRPSCTGSVVMYVCDRTSLSRLE